MSDPLPPETVNPADKPFYLVLILLGAVIGLGVLGIVNDKLDINQFLSALFPLLGTGLGLYFRKNGS